MPTISKKILPIALEKLFHDFVLQTSQEDNYKGYKLLAVDGSDIQIPTNLQDEDFVAEGFIFSHDRLMIPEYIIQIRQFASHVPVGNTQKISIPRQSAIALDSYSASGGTFLENGIWII